MSGTFRFTKSIATSILIAIVGFAMQYGQSFLFRDVEEVGIGFPSVNGRVSGRTSQSKQRSAANAGSKDVVEWKIAVVTNRVIDQPMPAFAAGQASSSIAEQVKNAMYVTPVTTYGTTPVRLPGTRQRGTCRTNLPAPNGVEVGNLKQSTRMEFLSNVGAAVAASEQRDILVFVHGFNVSLEDATARAAQIAEDMPFHGSMIAFSWQSAARSIAYLGDEVVAERFFWNLAELLADLRTSFPHARLHVLAHSMGNRVTLRAIESLCGTIDPAGRRDSISFRRYFDQHQSAQAQTFSSVITVKPAELTQRFPQWGAWHSREPRTPPISTLIMAAPDVAVQEFQLAIGNIQAACGKMILYASDTDYALHASRKVHGNYRAGDARAAVDIDGLSTIHITGVDTADPLGHSYYGSNPRVLDQLSFLLNQPASQVRLTTAANTDSVSR